MSPRRQPAVIVLLAAPLASLAAVLALSGGTATAVPTPVETHDALAVAARAGRVSLLVTLRDDASGMTAADARASIDRVQDALQRDLPPDAVHITWRYENVPVVAADASAAGVAALLGHPAVRAVQVDREERPALAEAVPAIHADAVQRVYGLSGEGVNVAVLDTGIDRNHPDLKDAIVAEKCFSARAGCAPNNAIEGDNAQDENGHGTGVAGIITSDGLVSARGVAPDAGIVAVRVFNDRVTANVSDVVKGLDWVLSKQRQYDIRLVNMSLGGDELYPAGCDNEDAARAEAVKRLQQRGVTVFAAAGNAGSLNGVAAPACLSDVIAVGATYDADVGRSPREGSFEGGCFDATTSSTTIACFSNSGAMVDLLAPGAWITHPRLGGGTAASAGTSDASPMAAGVAALLLEADDTLRPTELERTLERTGVTVQHPRNRRTFPLVDALKAVESLAPTPATAPPSPTATRLAPTVTPTPRPSTPTASLTPSPSPTTTPTPTSTSSPTLETAGTPTPSPTRDVAPTPTPPPPSTTPDARDRIYLPYARPGR